MLEGLETTAEKRPKEEITKSNVVNNIDGSLRVKTQGHHATTGYSYGLIQRE